MIESLFSALVASKNEAADDVLLEALSLGTPSEQKFVLRALLERKSVRGLGGVIGFYDDLPEALQLTVLGNIKLFHHALRDCGRTSDVDRRLAALKLVALGHQGKLAYILSENLHDSDEDVSKAAVDALVGLARWIAVETRRLQNARPQPAEHAAKAGASEVSDASSPRGALAGAPNEAQSSNSVAVPVVNTAEPSQAQPATVSAAQAFAPSAPRGDDVDESLAAQERARVYQELSEQRPEIEQAVARAMDVHRGRHGQELLRAALLLCDWAGSKTLSILHTAKHGGQSPMVRRLQQPPAAEHIEAFLLGASHGQLRSHFGVVFSHIDEAPVLDAMLRKTHWIKDHQLQLCLHQVTRGAWFGDAELLHDIERRGPDDAARIGEWIAASGMHDLVQDERLDRLRLHAMGKSDCFPARLLLLRIAMRRPRRGSSVALLRGFLTDPDERLVRMAAREIVRRRPQDFENMLLQLMTSAPPSVRRVISRSIGQSGFEQFWQRFDRLDKATRRNAGKAMVKMLPDATLRLGRKLLSGPIEQRLKAMQISQELQMAEAMRPTMMQLCDDPNPKLRSKAVAILGEMNSTSPDMLLDRALQDADARVRANAIEVLETKARADYLPLLTQRARAANSRERANAIKAMHQMKVKAASTALLGMLRDDRPEHRISAMWALKHMGWWQLINEVGRVAKADNNLRVRRYALGVLRGVADQMRAEKAKAG